MYTNVETVRKVVNKPSRLKRAGLSILHLPAYLLSSIFSGISALSALITGDVKNNRPVRQLTDVYGDERYESFLEVISRVGLLPLAFHLLVAEPMHYLIELPFAWLSNKTDKYQSEISIAFWVALGLGAAAATGGAVMAAYFPAALATLTSFSVFGVSLASIAGPSIALQLALFAGLVTAAADVAGLALAAVIDLGVAFVKWVRPARRDDEYSASSSVKHSSEPVKTSLFDSSSQQDFYTNGRTNASSFFSEKHETEVNTSLKEDEISEAYGM